MIARLSWVLLVLFVFTIPWEKSVALPGIGTLSRGVGAAALLTGAVAAVQRRHSLRRPNAVLLAAALFVVWTALTWLWSLDPAATAARVSTFAQLLAMMWLIWESARSQAEQRQLLHAYVAGAVVASAATIARYAAGLQTYWRRYAAPGFDPNDLGLTVTLAIPLALYLALRSGRGKAWIYRAAIAVCGCAVLLTASRMSLIAALVSFTFILLSWRESDAAQRWSSLLLAGLLVAGALWLAPKASRERIATLPGELTRGTLHRRTQIWKAGMRAFRQRPVLGVGAGAYPDAVRPFLGVPGVPGHEYVAHNTFLSVAVESGAIGFAIYAALLLLLALYVMLLPAAERSLWLTMLAVWAIGVSTLTWEHRKATWLLMALITTAWAQAWLRAPAQGGKIVRNADQ